MEIYISPKDICKTVSYEEENGKKQNLYVHDKEGFIIKELADHDKQVRLQICNEIKEQVGKLIERKDFGLCNWEYANGYCYGLQYDLVKILDTLQGDGNGLPKTND